MTKVSNVGKGTPELQLGCVAKADKRVEQGEKGTAGNNDNLVQIEVFSGIFIVDFLNTESKLHF